MSGSATVSAPLAPLPFTAGAALLSRLWRMRGEDTPHLSDQGEELDIEAFTASQVSRDPRVFSDPRRSNRGEAVILHILCDVSGSMSDYREPRKANAIGLAVMAAQSAVSAGITVNGLTFGDYIKPFPPIRSLQDVAKMKRALELDSWDGTTPTVEALAYTYQRALEAPAASHVVIVITDGQPDHKMLHDFSGRRPKSKTIQGKWSARACVDLMVEAGVEVFGFMVSADPNIGRHVSDSFGPDRYSVAASDHEAALGLARVVERFL